MKKIMPKTGADLVKVEKMLSEDTTPLEIEKKEEEIERNDKVDFKGLTKEEFVLMRRLFGADFEQRIFG